MSVGLMDGWSDRSLNGKLHFKASIGALVLLTIYCQHDHSVLMNVTKAFDEIFGNDAEIIEQFLNFYLLSKE